MTYAQYKLAMFHETIKALRIASYLRCVPPSCLCHEWTAEGDFSC